MTESNGLQIELGVTEKALVRQLARLERNMASTAKRMEVTFGNASTQTSRHIERVAKSTEVSIGRLTSKASGLATAFLGGVAGGAVAAAISGINTDLVGTIRSVAAVGDEAKRAGVSARAFQEWKFVAQQNRIGIDQMVDGLKELNLRADEFVVTGKGPAAEAFARLGYSSRDLKKKLEDPSALLLEIMDRLQGLDAAAQIRIADEVFGGSAGERFVELIGQGEDGLRRTIDRAHEIGAVMDDEMIAKAAELDRKFGELQTRLGTMFKTAAVSAADFFAAMNNGMPKDLGLFENGGQAGAVLGAGAAEAFRESSDAMAANMDLALQLIGIFGGVQDSAYAAAAQIQQAAGQLYMLGEAEAARTLSALADRMFEIEAGFRAGTLTADEFGGELQDATDQAVAVFNALSDVDRVSFGNVIANLGGLAASIGEAIRRALALRASLPGNEIEAAGVLQIGPSTRGGKRRAPVPTAAPAVSIRPQFRPMDLGDLGGSGGGGRGGRSARDNVQELLDLADRELQSWRDRLDLIGKTESASAALVAKQKLLNEAKRRGLDLDQVNAKTGETLRSEIDRQAAAIGNLAQKYDLATERADFLKDANDAFKDSILDAAVAGEGFSGVLDGIADRLKRAAAEALLFGSGPFSNGKSGGLLGGLFGGGSGGGLFGGLLSGLFGGFRASGGGVSSGKAYVVGEQGPEIFAPASSGQIIPNHAIFGGAMGGKASQGGAVIEVRLMDQMLDARIAEGASGVAVKVSTAQTRAASAAFPARQDSFAARGR